MKLPPFDHEDSVACRCRPRLEHVPDVDVFGSHDLVVHNDTIGAFLKTDSKFRRYLPEEILVSCGMDLACDVIVAHAYREIRCP